MKRILLTLMMLLLIPASSWAQQWVTANQISVAWDPVSVSSGVVSYKTYTKPAAGGVETFFSTVTTTTATITFAVEGRYFLGVQTVRTLDGTELLSTIAWSNNPADCRGGVTFGAQYYIPPAAPGGMRTP